uniref:Germin-like protein n=1 Tax=Physcomitrium patens TaxID=3218 RepID=A0A2K1IQJ4_PHYPA|nr:hypothetical protein PHYPA_025673 [Physcomitrium patens]
MPGPCHCDKRQFLIPGIGRDRESEEGPIGSFGLVWHGWTVARSSHHGPSHGTDHLRRGRTDQPAHTPRSTEMIYVVKGSIHIGFVATDNRLYDGVLEECHAAILPHGLLHFSLNVGKGQAEVIASFNSENPGLRMTCSAAPTLATSCSTRGSGSMRRQSSRSQGSVQGQVRQHLDALQI